MAPLTSFATPGKVADLTAAGKKAWSTDVGRLVDAQVAALASTAQFFNPLGVTLAADATVKPMLWGAFPRKLARLPAPRRWIDGEVRQNQEEYCEWSAIRDDNGRIIRAIFTTELPEYWHRLAATAPKKLVALYQQLVDPDILPGELLTSTGAYKPDNRWNRLGAVHMVQRANTLNAAITLVAQATVVRTGTGGALLTNPNDLIRCGVNADPDRNSDPLIVGDVNTLARTGAQLTLTDPIGLYLDNLQTTGWTTPDGADPATFWTITRGNAKQGLGVRATYEVPANLGYTVSDITINGRPISSPSQIAEAVQVRVAGLAHRIGTSSPTKVPCRAALAPSGSGFESLSTSLTTASLDDLQTLTRSTRG